MRITYVIPYFYPAWQYGGTPRVAFELARAMARRRHQVRVLTTDSGGESRLETSRDRPEWKADLDGLDVVYYRNSSNTLAYKYRLFWPRQYFKEIKARCAAADIVHVHEFRSTIGPAAVSAARSTNVPYVISPHGGLKHLGRAFIKTGFDAVYGKKMLAGASAVVAVSEIEVEEAKQFSITPSRVHHIPNPINFADFANLPAPGAFRGRWQLNQAKVILFLGRLHWVKGADLLLQAFSKIAQKDLSLVIAGPDDGQEAELRRTVQQLNLTRRVIFTGFLDVHQKIEALIDCDFVVVPSRSEVFSVAALEALLVGKPVLVSSACGLHAKLQADFGVLRFENGTQTDLAFKLQDMIGDHLLKENAMNARSFVIQEFSPEAVAARTEALYSRCVGEFHNAR